MSDETEPRSVAGTIYGYVNGRVKDLYKGYVSGSGTARATLANLRSGAGKPPGDSLEVWAETLAYLPDDLKGHGDRLSKAEKAVYLALCLFAVHQQSKSASMHIPRESGKWSISFGAAVSKLEYLTEGQHTNSPVRRRFNAVATSRDFNEISHHARGLIRQLRGENIPLDYAQLAVDLFFLQSPASATTVKRRWTRDYFEPHGKNHPDSGSSQTDSHSAQ
ncbi:type I-E CRISPR-associated protein Cse2/CasB [Corynebacterium mendelii]|uniref:Type I-E CRISPR-associated protein Cse2/CasB n=1 Tax=Corynebacterium mendelii TaxID=2765362 RepID=A0A939IXP6_9CORY|nr:type I-E CRISPR-associated protein Cse2/CasB [Corynebacterium mendelii]MBN9644273.1 type I-E CRISPR-associated protein Cse2/CasB [Corynebacterium mendelii]